MKRVPAKTMAAFFLVALAATAAAQEDALEMGCDVYDGYWLCPQARVVANAPLEYTSDVECYELFEESLGCIGKAKLLSDVSFEACWIYIPLLSGNEIDFDNYQYNYGCVEKSWSAGSVVNVSIAPYQVGSCSRVEGDEGYEVQQCETTGQRIVANASIDENGGKYMMVVTSAPYTGMHVEWWHWIVIIIGVIAIIWAIGKSKK